MTLEEVKEIKEGDHLMYDGSDITVTVSLEHGLLGFESPMNGKWKPLGQYDLTNWILL